jgi:hypothetical protein
MMEVARPRYQLRHRYVNILVNSLASEIEGAKKIWTLNEK